MEEQEKDHLLETFDSYNEDFLKARKDYWAVRHELDMAGKQYFEALKSLANFELFLIRYHGREYLASQDVDGITNRVNRLTAWEDMTGLTL